MKRRIVSPPVHRLRPKVSLLGLACALCCALVASGCGQEIEVPTQDASLREGADLFNQRCSGCHTLEAAAASGSTPEGQLKYAERTDGPNFNTRKESVEDVLYALRNGGFSGAIMPANIVVGEDAELIAKFVCAYAGQKPDKPKPGAECLVPPEDR